MRSMTICEEAVYQEDPRWISRLVDYLRDPSSPKPNLKLSPSTKPLSPRSLDLPNLSLMTDNRTDLLKVERRRM